MHYRAAWPRGMAVGGRSVGLALAVALAACSDENVLNIVPPANSFAVTRLVADNGIGGAPVIDANLINPWGIAFASTGILWVSNNGSGVATLYNTSGSKLPTVVAIPGVSNGGIGMPTGIVMNQTTGFVIRNFGPAQFIFADLDGTLAAANTATIGARIVVDRSAAGAGYTGIAMAQNGLANFIYAANFRHNSIDMFDSTFTFVRSFTDFQMVPGFAPFGIANIGGQLFVTFAKQAPPDSTAAVPEVGNGFVDVFNADGSLAKRLIAGGPLNAPWGVVLAPAGFGPFGGAILVGNFGDGKIGAYSATTGAFIDFLRNGNGDVIAESGLWGLAFGPAGDPLSLFFAAGVNNERGGLVGTITQILNR